MTEKEIMQYRQLGILIERKKKQLDNKLEQLDKVPVVSGKVTGSQATFPYITVHPTVEISEPKQSDKIHREMDSIEREIADAERRREEIVNYIMRIKDVEMKNIFEMRVYDGMKWADIATEMDEDKLGNTYLKKFQKYINTHKM